MRRNFKHNHCEYQPLESRRLLAGDLTSNAPTGLGPTSLTWVDAAGNAIGASDIPNRTEITARLITSQSLADTLTASIFEDDTFGDDFITNIQLNRIAANIWEGQWQATWSDDGAGLPEYYFQVAGVSGSSNNIDVLQGNGWHVQKNATGILNPANAINVSIQPAEIPAGLNLDQVAFEIDFGNVAFANSQHPFQLVVTGPHSGWSESIVIDQNYDFADPIVEVFRSAGCDDACPGNDFTESFLTTGLSNGFYGNWSVTAMDLASGDSIGIANFRTTLTFHSRLNLSGYDSQLQPDDPYPKSDRDYGYVSDFNNLELQSNSGTTSAVIFIHGWNPGPDGLGSNFIETYGGKFWNSIEQSIGTFVKETSNWLVGQYDWVNDAATGSNSGTDILATLASAPLSSRDVGTAHGPFLGRALYGGPDSLFSQLDAVQLIAHSAGNWVALEAAAYLRAAGFNGDLQLTSLDPFVPDVGMFVGITAGVETERIFESGAENFQFPNDALENYYVDDAESDIFFGWTSGDYSTWTINRRLDSSNPAPLFNNGFDVHSGPIGWYSTTASFLYNGGDLGQLEENGQSLGFGSSLLFQDWRFENAIEIAANSFSIVRGQKFNGSTSDLSDSDDSYLSVRPDEKISEVDPPILIEFSGTLSTPDPEVLGFQFESSTNTVNIVQSIELFNFDTGTYEQFDVTAATINDSVVTIQLSGDLTRYVSPTGEVRVRIGWNAEGPVLLFPWTVNIDQAVWLTDPAGTPAPVILPPGDFANGRLLNVDPENAVLDRHVSNDIVDKTSFVQASRFNDNVDARTGFNQTREDFLNPEKFLDETDNYFEFQFKDSQLDIGPTSHDFEIVALDLLKSRPVVQS